MELTPAGVARLSSPTTVATYDYLGTGHLVGTTLDQANLNTSVFAESGGTHSYADLDRFNRPTRWNWERVGGSSGGFYNTAVAYDENSNPVSTTDAARARNNSSDHPFDVVYGLDSLNRVISADEGNATGSPLAIESGTRTRKELWNSLSLTGNWGNRQLDANGDGDCRLALRLASSGAAEARIGTAPGVGMYSTTYPLIGRRSPPMGWSFQPEPRTPSRPRKCR